MSVRNLLKPSVLAVLAAVMAISFSACGKAKTWGTREATDITLELPFVLGPGPDVKAQLPQQVLNVIEYMEVLDTGDGTNPRATVSRAAYKAGTQVSLDGAMNGAMNGAMAPLAKAGGDTGAKFTSSSLTIDGLPARKASYTGKVDGKAIHLDSVFIQRGQKFWQVQVITTGDSSAADISRILDSVHIKPEAAK